MFFLKTVSILIQLKETKDSLIFGDEEYKDMPSLITDTSYDNVNWNRMLKYETSDLGKGITRSSYAKATYDIYLDTVTYKLNILAKNSFDEFVSKQNKFIKEFVPNLIKAINFNKQESEYELPRELFKNYLVEEYKELPVHIDNFLVNKDFDNKNNKYKFKNIYQLDDHNETIETKNGQFIHHVKLDLNQTLANAKFIDLNNSTVYLNGYIPVGEDKVYLNLKYEDKENVKRASEKINGRQ